MLVWVDVCCNREGGYFDNRASHISFPDDCITLERWSKGDPLAFDEDNNSIRILRKNFPIVSCNPCVGNWFWNGYLMRAYTAAQLLVRCKRSRKFGIDGGWLELGAWWDMPENAEPPLHWLVAHLVEAQRGAKQ